MLRPRAGAHRERGGGLCRVAPLPGIGSVRSVVGRHVVGREGYEDSERVYSKRMVVMNRKG